MKKTIHHHRLWIAITTTIVVLSSIAIYSLSKKNVEYVSPRHGAIVEAVYGLGKVKTNHFYELKLGITKTVEELYVSEGSHIKKGDELVRMEGDTLFRAPFDGIVTLLAFHESQPVFPQQTILRLDDPSKKFIEVSLEQQGALRVKKGQPVQILFESIRGEKLNGVVRSLFSRNEEFLAHIHVEGLSENILPGMTADIAIEIERKQNSLLIPLSAINNGRVGIKRGDKQRVVNLKIGGIDGNWAEVLEGDIQDDDLIIIPKGR